MSLRSPTPSNLSEEAHCREAATSANSLGQSAELSSWSQALQREAFLWKLLPSALILLLVAALYLLGLGRSALFDPDEGRHAEIAREALETGNWITPTLNYEPYHHKPMPFYWLVGAGLRAFPHDPEFGARLPSATAAILAVTATTGWATALLGPMVGLLSAIILGTAGGFFVAGRVVLVDMSFTWWVTASHLAVGWLALSRSARFWWLPWACVGVAVLLKGPAALVLLAGSMLTFSVATRGWGWLRKLRPVPGLAVALMVGGSWYALAAMNAPDYVRDFLWLHNVERFVSGAPGHPRNPFYYLYTLPAIFLPWSLWWPLALSPVLQKIREKDRVYLFCASWALVVVLFFSASSSKLPTYVLPAFPPLAILTAAGLATLLHSADSPAWASTWAKGVHYVLAGVALAVALMGWLLLRLFGEAELAEAVLMVSGSAALLSVVGWWLQPKPSTRFSVTFVTLACVASELVFSLFAAPHLQSRYSLRDAAQALAALPEIAELYSYRAGYHSLLFYSQRQIVTLEDIAAAARLLASDHPAALLTKRSHARDVLCATQAPLFQLWTGERNKILLANAAAAQKAGSGWSSPAACDGPAQGQGAID
ncbi:MAG: glycosyltransferase family 39 protein [Candidatus Binatia bacterium]|nr:glycosyltransferase family 39 protein [Candidatus Binatia bacterium]